MGTEPTPKSVLPRVAANVPDALSECMDRYGSLVWALARRWSRNEADAEDAVQEVFLALWKSASRFDDSKSSEKTFIAMVTRRRLIDRIRYSKRRPELQALPEGGGEPAGDQHEKIHLSVEAAQAAEYLETLKDAQRRVIELSIYYGLTHSEISAATEIPLGTVKSHIFRGLAQVRKNVIAQQGASA